MMQSTGSIWVRALRLVHRNDRSFEPRIESARICGFCQFYHTIKWIRFAICLSLSELSHSCILSDGMAVVYLPQNLCKIYPYFQFTVCFLEKWPQTKCKVTFDTCFWHSFLCSSHCSYGFSVHGSRFNHLLHRCENRCEQGRGGLTLRMFSKNRNQKCNVKHYSLFIIHSGWISLLLTTSWSCNVRVSKPTIVIEIWYTKNWK